MTKAQSESEKPHTHVTMLNVNLEDLEEMFARDISVEEAKKILTEGKSDLIEDFTSRRGKPFPAYLILEANKVGFEFPPRAPPADARNFQLSKGC